ncbi:MAG: serine hydrolase domain-containing protein [Owenweeksia sp.]|nr:serine hydrolase domain-containing protein [Owenweeksia sp.]
MITLCCFGFSIVFGQRIARLDNLFYKVEKNNKVMGSIAIFENGEPAYQNAFGYAVVSGFRPDSLTRYLIGSVSKTFTAVVILQMVDEGQLNLNDKHHKFYPDWPGADVITIEHLLRHRSGIHNFAETSNLKYRDLNPQTNPEIEAIFKGAELDFKPGSKAEYNNANYLVLSLIAEKLDGDSFAGIINRRISKPLNLTRTCYGHKINPANNEAYAYTKRRGKWQPMKDGDRTSLKGAGALTSTPQELCKFFTALFQYSIVNPHLLEEMKSLKDGFGLGLFQYPYLEKRAYGHAGSIGGFETFAAYFPEEKVAIAVCLNGGGEEINSILRQALAIWFDSKE